MVGGSGLYLKAITHGLSPTPKADPVLRAELEALPLETLVDRFRELDPEGAAATNPEKPALRHPKSGNLPAHGRPASELKQEWTLSSPPFEGSICNANAPISTAGSPAAPPRCSRPEWSMRSPGSAPLSVTAEKAIGLREIRALLRGEMSEADCRESIRLATRQYAKRQETWFRREPGFVPLPVAPDEAPDETARRIAERFRLPR